MAVNPKTKSEIHSFKDDYYQNKFNEKGVEFFEQLQRNPNDLEAEEKLKFVESVLKTGNKEKWPTLWHEWEKNKFCWPIGQLFSDKK